MRGRERERERERERVYFYMITVMYKTIFIINIIIHMCLQHSNTL